MVNLIQPCLKLSFAMARLAQTRKEERDTFAQKWVFSDLFLIKQEQSFFIMCYNLRII